MKTSMNIQVSIWSVLILSQISWSRGASTDCTKLSEPLCSNVSSKTNEDTVYVNLYLLDPSSLPDSCKSIDLRTHPDSNCNQNMDSALWGKLKEETEEVYSKFSSVMMDVKHPSQTLPHPNDSAGIFFGVLVTKSNLLLIVQDTNVVYASPFFYSSPIAIYSQKKIGFKNQDEKWLNFSVNGQVIQAADRSKYFRMKIQR